MTLLTGFLGAGKTTLLNHLLAARPETRFAVVENEFGDVGVDGAMITGSPAALIEITDGCVCCTVHPDLVTTFERLADQAGALDHVLIETSGLADPVPVMKLFESGGPGASFRLDGVVTVVDVAHIETDLAESETCLEQIAYSDVLVLNKTDTGGDLDALEARLGRINPLAERLRATRAQVDPGAVLGVGGHDLGASMALRSERSGHAPQDAHHHHHDDAVTSVAVELDGDVDVRALDLWLGDLVRDAERTVLRMKGVLAVPGDPRRFLFHGVRRQIEVRPERPWGDESRASRLVFIGRGLDGAALQRGFERCAPRV